jgi:hypothetical protein
LDDSLKYSSNSETALTKAAMNSDSFTWEIIRRGANANTRCVQNFTVLWACVKCRHDPELIRAVLKASNETTLAALTPDDLHSVLVTAVRRLTSPWNPSHWSGAKEIILVLLEFVAGDGSGIQFDKRDRQGLTAMQHLEQSVLHARCQVNTSASEYKERVETFKFVLAHFHTTRERIAAWRAGYDSIVFNSVGLTFQIPVLLALIKSYVIVK